MMIMMGETTTTSAATNSIGNISSSSSPPTMPPPKQNHAAVLRCPRCDSTNTKFCYYNNYSLSQPRHFCKACKRYWTRGGTLRNVPVGGGCRKNKRVKKSSASAAVAVAAAVSTDLPRSSSLISSLASANLDNFNSFLFGLPSSSSVNLATNFASYSMPNCTRVDGAGENNQFQLGFGTSLQQSDSFFNGCQRKFDDYPSLLPYQNLQVSDSASFCVPREVKVERESNVIDPWQLPNSMMNPFEDSSNMYWNSAVMGSAAWPDIANSSIAPLI